MIGTYKRYVGVALSFHQFGNFCQFLVDVVTPHILYLFLTFLCHLLICNTACTLLHLLMLTLNLSRIFLLTAYIEHWKTIVLRRTHRLLISVLALGCCWDLCWRRTLLLLSRIGHDLTQLTPRRMVGIAALLVFSHRCTEQSPLVVWFLFAKTQGQGGLPRVKWWLLHHLSACADFNNVNCCLVDYLGAATDSTIGVRISN